VRVVRSWESSVSREAARQPSAWPPSATFAKALALWAVPLRRLRGEVVAYVPQDPGSTLNPARRIRDAISDMRRLHGRTHAREQVAATLQRVELPDDESFTRRYPHQLSGGQQQRVSIALGLTLEPPLVVLDEPTTGLDVVTQARILDEVARLRDELGVGMLYITHDVAVVAQIANRIAVMYAGRVVEEGPIEDIIHRPRHPYTAALMASVPDIQHPRHLQGIAGQAPGPGEWPHGCAFSARCPLRVDACDQELPNLRNISPVHRVRCLRANEVRAIVPRPRSASEARFVDRRPVLEVLALGAVHRSRYEAVIAAQDVAFSLRAGACTALVGESGSGKTTIARCVAGLHSPDQGEIILDGAPLAPRVRQRSHEHRRRIQMVFQNPAEALNPRQEVAEQISRPARILRNLSASQASAETIVLLERVRLPHRTLDRYPRELSGGERQRVAIARALAAQPDVMVCDEITSALDVSVQAAVLELLHELQTELGLALLFITHDLGVVASVADEVTVLQNGRILEAGDVFSTLTAARHDYTRRLLESAPALPPADEIRAAVNGDDLARPQA
jgi:peptide/nickel transport system ATP-binding protein